MAIFIYSQFNQIPHYKQQKTLCESTFITWDKCRGYIWAKET